MNLDVSVDIALALTVLGLVAACIRMFLGPTAADRIVALDLVTILLVAITSLFVLQMDNAAYLDLGLALALVGFLATVAFARYLEVNKFTREQSSNDQQGLQTQSDTTGKQP